MTMFLRRQVFVASKSASLIATRSMSSAIQADLTTQHITLPDERKLCYAEFGKANGTPLLYCHGYPMSRLEGRGLDSSARQHGIRVIVPDRPGFGQSTFQAQRKITDWPKDVRHLLKHLTLSTVSVLGASGGGPYALACADIFPNDMISGSIKLLSSAPPFEAGINHVPWLSWFTWKASVHTPKLFELFLSTLVAAVKGILKTGSITRRVDQWLESQPRTQEMEDISTAARRQRLYEGIFDGFAQGSQSTVQEALLLAGSWDMQFEKIDALIEIWHGTKDARAPIEMIRYMSQRLPNCQLHEFDGGHIDMVTQLDLIMKQIAEEAGTHVT